MSTPPVCNARTIELLPLAIRAAIAPSSIDEENRTVEVTFTTGAAVKRYDWMSGERYIEKLSLNPDHVRLDRINNGGPVLDSHSGYSLSSVLGVVEDGTAKATGKKGIATLRFSKRSDVDPIWQDVKDRVYRNVSVGYIVHTYQETAPPKEGGLKTRLAIDWEPFEISMVPMPADAGAQTRDGKSVATTTCQIVTRGSTPVSPPEEPHMEREEQSETVVEQDPLDPGAPTPRMTAAPPAEPTDADRAALNERARTQGITQACRAARMPAEFMDRLIADGVALVDAQSRIFEEMRKRGGDAVETRSQVHDVRLGDDPFIHVRAGIENALQHRIAPQYFKLEEPGKVYRGMTMIDVAKVYLQGRGLRVTGMSKLEIAGLALGLNYRTGMHTTSDFALLLADVAGKTLRKAYEEAPPTFLPIARRITLPDFKVSKRLQIGDAPDLRKVLEHGEFTRGTIGEGKEEMQLATYGRIFAITRQALVNDDTDAFARVPMLFGRAARKLESDLVWEQITSNPTMGDTNALFSAAHGNLQTDGDVISIASMTRARVAMRMQTGLNGTTQLNLVPRFLIVPAQLETVAEQFIAPLMNAQTVGNQNPFSGKFTVITEPRLDANSTTAWYLSASPDQVDILEYAYLEGEEGPVTENRVGFDIDGLEIKSRLDFAAKVVDWRGLHKDPGEAVS